MKRSTRVLAGLFTIVIASALFVVGEFFLEGENLVMNPGDDPEAFERIVAGGGFTFFAVRGLIGVFLETVAFISLYLYLQNNRVEPVAFWGMITSVLGDFGGAVFFGTLLFVYPHVAPYIGGNAELASALSISPVLFGVAGISTLAGLVLFAVAIWRCGVLPKWSGVLMLVGFLVLAVQIFAIQILGNALWGLGGLWIFLHAWKNRESRPVRRGRPA